MLVEAQNTTFLNLCVTFCVKTVREDFCCVFDSIIKEFLSLQLNQSADYHSHVTEIMSIH